MKYVARLSSLGGALCPSTSPAYSPLRSQSPLDHNFPRSLSLSLFSPGPVPVCASFVSVVCWFLWWLSMSVCVSVSVCLLVSIVVSAVSSICADGSCSSPRGGRHVRSYHTLYTTCLVRAFAVAVSLFRCLFCSSAQVCSNSMTCFPYWSLIRSLLGALGWPRGICVAGAVACDLFVSQPASVCL